MNPAILMYALQFAQALPSLIATGQSVMGLVNHASSAMQTMLAENRGPTAQEWAALDAQTDALRAQLHAGEIQPPAAG